VRSLGVVIGNEKLNIGICPKSLELSSKTLYVPCKMSPVDIFNFSSMACLPCPRLANFVFNYYFSPVTCQQGIVGRSMTCQSALVILGRARRFGPYGSSTWCLMCKSLISFSKWVDHMLCVVKTLVKSQRPQ